MPDEPRADSGGVSLDRPHQNPDEAALQDLLRRARRIAVVGLSPKPQRDSHRVARYLIDRGYEVVPVYPRDSEILGCRVYRSVSEVTGGVDLVDVFRNSRALPDVVEDAILAGAPALWFQLGCIHEAAARRAQGAGMTVVMDRCIMVDHARLLGRGWKRS